MALLSASEKQRVSEAVARAETRTAGEIVVVVAARSDDYARRRALYALLLTIAVLSEAFVRLHAWPPWLLFVLEIPVALGAYALFGWGPVLRRVVPKAEQRAAVDSRIKQAFVEFGLTETRDRSGVLIFVSELEHRVRLLADRGVNERVEAGAWQRDLDALIAAIAQGRPGDGLVTAVTHIGELLAEHFPRNAGDANELGDHVREI